MSESHSSISSDPPGEGVGLEGFMMVASVVSNGGRPLKVVDPSAACREKIVSLKANCGAIYTIAKELKLRLRDGKRCDIEPFLGRFRVF